jgi:hypothetical protein
MQPNHIPTRGFTLPFYLSHGYAIACVKADAGRYAPITVEDGAKVVALDTGLPLLKQDSSDLDTEWVFNELELEHKCGPVGYCPSITPREWRQDGKAMLHNVLWLNEQVAA